MPYLCGSASFDRERVLCWISHGNAISPVGRSSGGCSRRRPPTHSPAPPASRSPRGRWWQAAAYPGNAVSVQAVSMSSADAPDVVVMDYRLPDGTGAQAGEQIRNQRPRPRLVFVSGDESEDALLSTVRAGACGFLPKSRGVGGHGGGRPEGRRRGDADSG